MFEKMCLLDNYKVIKEMTEEEVNISIKLLKDLVDYHLAMNTRNNEEYRGS